MLCPVCKQNFGKGVKRCPLHGARLVDPAEAPEHLVPTLRDEPDFGEDPTIHGTAVSRDERIGRQFQSGRFIADEQIGEGAMGVVFRGRDLSVSPPEPVAIKVLKAQESDELGLEARFKREAMLVSKLAHPNTIRFIDFGTERDGTMFLVTELLVGMPLDKLIEKHPGGIGEERTLEIVDQVAASLEDAHRRGVIHRDIKPANVFVDGNKAKLLDFGIARIAWNGMELSKTFAAKTSTGMALFTPMYCSPEQAVGDELDHRSDFYSLGVVAYHCVSGKTPFKGGLAGLIEAHVSKEAPAIKDRAPAARVTYATEMLIRKMMAKKASDRFQNGSEIRSAIAEIRGDGKPTKLTLPRVQAIVPPSEQDTQEGPKDEATEASSPARRMPLWILGAIAAAFLVLGYLVIRALLPSS
jgi:serine/threonine-protein kinase